MARLNAQAAGECDVPDLYAALWGLLGQIPRGRVATYGGLAEALGNVVAARWVGEFLLDHGHQARCPCHRVVRRTGEIGLYISRDTGEKERRIRREGVKVSNGVVDLNRFEFFEFDGDRPLERLSRFQESLPERVILNPLAETPDAVGGVDVSYIPPREAVGAYVLVDVADGSLLWSTTVRMPVRFPYIAGYLAFREVPILQELVDRARDVGKLANVVFVDGNGILHHRHAGIATHLGVTAGVTTIGVGKKLLCGQVDLAGLTADEARPVTHDGQVVGSAQKAKPTSRPIFVSPGQGIGVEDAARMARLLFHGHRVPEPIYWADRLSRQAVQEVRRMATK